MSHVLYSPDFIEQLRLFERRRKGLKMTALRDGSPYDPIPWPDPSPEMLATPEFEAVWQCIKKWDINVPDAYAGYCGANGNHVRAILDALYAVGALPKRTTTENDIVERLLALPYRLLVDYGNGDVRDKLDPNIVEAVAVIMTLRIDVQTTLTKNGRLYAALKRAADDLDENGLPVEAREARRAL